MDVFAVLAKPGPDTVQTLIARLLSDKIAHYPKRSLTMGVLVHSSL